jgi:hypothetical protein
MALILACAAICRLIMMGHQMHEWKSYLGPPFACRVSAPSKMMTVNVREVPDSFAEADTA